ncbi:MAG: uroporphyrinogen-III synthase, partial [Polyangiales bacterium]
DVVEAYRTVPPDAAERKRLRALFDDAEVDIVTFTSSSTARNLAEVLADAAAERLAGVTVASIGPITTETARSLGIRVDVTAEQYTVAGLVDALQRHVSQHAKET